MPLKDYTTKIDPDRTCGEISRLLSQHGAIAVMTEYDDESHLVTALSFKMRVGESVRMFHLPADWRPVQEVLIEQKKKNSRIDVSQEQAVRTAWRIVKDWVDAQMAFIESHQARTEQAFLPYMVVAKDTTLSDMVLKNPKFLLSGGE